MEKLSRILDKLSGFLAPRKGLLPLLGLVMIVLNFIFQMMPASWLSETNFLLHLGLVIAILGFLLAAAL